MDIDEILHQLGEFGRYQKIKYLIICIIGTTCAIMMYEAVFITAVPKHRCAIPGLGNDTYEIQDERHEFLVNQTIPLHLGNTDSPYDRCTIFNSVENRTVVSCNKWVYDKSVFTATFATKVDLVCDNSYLLPMLQMIYFGGLLVGSCFIGAISDIIGRKKALFVSYFFHITSGFAIMFSPDFFTFAAMRFFTGIAAMGMFYSGRIIGLEFVGASKRVVAVIAIDYVFPFGMLCVTLVAYFVRDWYYLQLAITVPSIAYIGFWWLIPESPRWLISKGRYKEAEVILRQAAKTNKVELSDELFETKANKEEEDSSYSILAIVKSKVLILRLLALCYIWFVVNIVYYGLGLNAGNLGGDLFINFVISGLVELPAYTLCIFGLDKFGRKKLNFTVMIIGGLACTSTIFTIIWASPSLNWITIALAMIGKFCISIAFATIVLHTLELYPTLFRHTVVGIGSSCARIGGMIGPFFVVGGDRIGGDFGRAFPLLLFGVLTLIAAFLLLILPETANIRLPRSMEEAENIGKRGYEIDRDADKKNSVDDAMNGQINSAFTRL